MEYTREELRSAEIVLECFVKAEHWNKMRLVHKFGTSRTAPETLLDSTDIRQCRQGVCHALTAVTVYCPNLGKDGGVTIDDIRHTVNLLQQGVFDHLFLYKLGIV